MIEALTPAQVAQFEKLCEECSQLPGPEDCHDRLAEAQDPTLTDLLQLALAEPVSVRNLLPGTRLDEFELVERLGGGGFGEVWRARRPTGGEPDVAIKLIRLEHLHGGDAGRFLAYFREEIRRHGELHHPGIVKLICAGSAALPGFDEPVPYLVMELWPGAPLHHACRGRTVAEKISCLIQACAAVQYAHRHGLMHLDLKPENILVVENAGRLQVKILDFGLARAFQADRPLLANRFGAGTLPYQAPEQIDRDLGGEDFRTDVHALGVILFQLLTDRLPYPVSSGTVAEFRQSICQGPRLRLKDFDESIDDQLQAVCERAMAIERSRRFDSPARLAAALRKWLGLRARLSQHPRLIALALLLVLITVGAFVVNQALRNDVRDLAIKPPIGANSNSLAITLATPIVLERVHFNLKVRSEVNPDDCYWRDICWMGKQGWLCGGVDEDANGSGQFVGHGVLLHTTDGGKLWEEIPRTNFDAGAGTFSCFEEKTWNGLGPVTSIEVTKMATPDGQRFTNGWAATVTGIFFTSDAGNPAAKWTRLTPPPDGPACSSFYSGLTRFDDREIYAFGWQGISHFTQESAWQVELKTHIFPIQSFAVLSIPYRDLWAAGCGGPDALGRRDSSQSTGAIYHFAPPGANWERVPLPGVQFQPGETLAAISVLRNSYDLLALGPNGLVLRGVMEGTNRVWSSSRLSKQGLNFALENSDGFLWVIGQEGTIFKSPDDGHTWLQTPCTEKDGSRIHATFQRVRFDEAGRGWFVTGTGLFTYTPSP